MTTGASSASTTKPASILVCSAGQCDGRSANAGIQQQPVGNAAYTSTDWAGAEHKSIVAKAQVTTAGGSVFDVVDTYGIDGSAFVVDRKVSVRTAGADAGFNSQFLLGLDGGRERRVFAPGRWYDDGPQRAVDYWRETKSTLPLAMVQDGSTGSVLSLGHVSPAPSSTANEDSVAWLRDGGIKYGSLGVQDSGVGFLYPMAETSKSTGAWIRRSNPVTAGYTQQYRLLLSLRSGGGTFNDAMAATWRLYYSALYDPSKLVKVPTQAVMKDGVDLIASLTSVRNGYAGTLGVTTLPDAPDSGGAIYVMGYVGQSIPLGFQLYRYGLLTKNAAIQAKGESILDFWTQRAPLGTPRLPGTRFGTNGVYANNDCQDPIFLRYVGDGLEAMATAAAFAREHGQPRTAWEQLSLDTGRWLARHQNDDGSWDRAYNPDGTRFTRSTSADGKACNGNTAKDDALGKKMSTTHVLRFLVELYEASGDPEIKTALDKAAAFAYAQIFTRGKYVGGTTDTGNVLDKEGGMIALHAALALHDYTHDAKWLTEAKRAAAYAESFTYAYNFTIKDADKPYAYAGTRGSSLIGTAGSAVDIGSSVMSFDLFRLYVHTGDKHYLTAAQQIESETKYTTQLGGVPDQQYGYRLNGLTGEAASVANMRWTARRDDPNGVPAAYQWLPWLTNTQLDPLQRMDDLFGDTSIDQVLKTPLETLRQKNDGVYQAAPGSAGWSAK